jgi:hypothetical protein
MSYQSGGWCYAYKVDALPSACASFAPLSSLQGTVLTSVSCSGVDVVAGVLVMSKSVVDTSIIPPVPVVTSFTQALDFAPCVQSEYVAAFEGLLAPVLLCVVSCWGLWRIAGYLGWGRGEA